MSRRTAMVAAVTVVLAGATIGGGALALRSDGLDDLALRQAEVRERGQNVMPFGLERTTHVFRKTASGGIEQVLADDATDRDSITLVAGTLSANRRSFAAATMRIRWRSTE